MADDWIGVEEMRKAGRLPAKASEPAAPPPERRAEMKVVPASGVTSYGSYARSIIKGRRRIRSFFDADLFGDPVFDMLLFLFSSEEEGADVSITACCAASGVPPTTAARWLREMEVRGMVVRHQDPANGRSIHVRLSPTARTSMQSWLTEISSIPLSREL